MSGIYIHIPFCRQACHYCNFHFTTSLRLKEELIAALIREISISPEFVNSHDDTDLKKDFVETIYFGGGTPSILTTEELKLIFIALSNKFVIAPDAEITLEANPDDINSEKLIQWKETGINRLSVGVQSFSEKELTWMNRVHTAAESLQCIEEIKATGYSNFSIDLIYGSALLDNDGWQQNVEIAIEKKIPHISCYALTVEPKTALAKMIDQNKKQPVDTEKQATQFLLLMKWMKQAGYEHYEISNFSLPGMRSRHNSSYWKGKNYYGFGPSAHSFDGNGRRWNIANNALYIESLKKNIIPSEEEILTQTQRLNEYIMTSLRTMEGLDLEKISNDFGKNFNARLQEQSRKWKNSNKLKIDDGKIILTTKGKLFADGIAADLFF